MPLYTLHDAPRVGIGLVPNMVTSLNNQSVVSQSSKSGAIPETISFVEHLFPRKLWIILNNAALVGYADIISWVDNGTAFQIHDRERAVPILEKYFRVSMYKSFMRQLQAYGFERLIPNAMDDPHKDSRPKRNQQRGKWKHDFFRSDNRDLCHKIVRRGKEEPATETAGTIEQEKGLQQKQDELQQKQMQQLQQQQYRLQVMKQNQLLQQQQALHHIHLPLHQQGLVHQFQHPAQQRLIAPLGAVPTLPPAALAQEQRRRQMQLQMMNAPTPAAQTLLATANYNNAPAATAELEKAQLEILERRRRLVEAQKRAQEEAIALSKAEAAIAKARELTGTESTNVLKRSLPLTPTGPVKKRLDGEKPFASILGELDNAFDNTFGDKKKTSDDSVTKGSDSMVARDVIRGAGSATTNPVLGMASTEMMHAFAKTAAAAMALQSNGPSTGVKTAEGSSTVPQAKTSRATVLANASHVVTESELEAARKMMKTQGTIEQINKEPVKGHWELVHPSEFQQSTALAEALPEVATKSSILSNGTYQILSKQLSPPERIRVPEGWDVSKDPIYIVVDPTKAGESSKAAS